MHCMLPGLADFDRNIVTFYAILCNGCLMRVLLLRAGSEVNLIYSHH